jgi:hypothetical protein
VDNNTGTGYKTFFRELLLNHPESKYFDTENLFYFKDNKDESDVTEVIKDFYERSGDPALLEMISRIPFPLVINVCPDKALNNVYTQKGLPFNEGYFAIGSKPEFNDIPIPTKENPVIYNIFGSVELDNSLILTHSKLFKTIEYLLPENSLPDKIEYYLNNIARSFIFLGFKFDSWQYQLVCHKLKSINPRTNVSTPHFNDNEKVKVIMGSSFNMVSVDDNSTQCISKITTACEENTPGSLRERNPNGSFSAFVSYAWNDVNEKHEKNLSGDAGKGAKRELIVDYIGKNFDAGKMYQLFRDKNDLQLGDSIDSFMTRIGMGKTAIRVISEKYLKSIYCMSEAYRIENHSDAEKRILNIVLGDANIADLESYKNYWYDKCQDILKDRSKLDLGQYDDYVRVYRFVDSFLYNLSDKVNLSLEYDDLYTNEAGEINVKENIRDKVNAFISTVTNKMEE